MTEFDVYWILKLDAIRNMIIFAGLILAHLCILSYALSEAVNKKLMLHVFGVCFGVILFISGVMVPSTKEMCAMKVVPKIANSSEFATVKKDLGEVYTLGMEHIKTALSNKEEK